MSQGADQAIKLGSKFMIYKFKVLNTLKAALRR